MHCESVSELGLADRVVFPGFLTQAELVELYRHAAMLVYASLCGPENLPPLEAMALGCPVLAAAVPGADEQLRDVALLFDPISPGDIAEKVARVHLDAGLRAGLRERGLKRARAWTAADFAAGMLALFDEFSLIRRTWRSGEKA